MSGAMAVGWMKGCFHSAVCPNTRCLEVEYVETFKWHLEFFYSSPWCSSLPRITLAIFSVLYDNATIFLFTQTPNCSYHWIFFSILILSIVPIHSVLNSYKFRLYSDSYNCNLYLKFRVHLLFACCLPVHHCTISSMRIETLTAFLIVVSPAPRITCSTHYKVNNYFLLNTWTLLWYFKMPALYFNYLCMCVY